MLTKSDSEQWLTTQCHEVEVSDAMWAGSYINDARLCVYIANIMDVENCPPFDGVGGNCKIIRVGRTPSVTLVNKLPVCVHEEAYRKACPPSWKLIPVCIGLPPLSFDMSQIAKRDP